ncbi:MAG: tetratricopeptide repeat protein [Opitutae bacterium]|nr:tetratricopeptide repeat protein [Opitutae bacterium]
MLKPLLSLRRSLTVLLLASGLTGAVLAQEVPREYQISDKTSEEFAKLKPLADAKNWDGAVAILDAQLAKVEGTSYDAAMLQYYKGQMLLQKGDYPGAIQPIETYVQLSDSHTPTYADEKTTLEVTYILAQLYYSEATTTKNPTLAAQYYDKAEKAMARWTKFTKKPTADALSFYASLLFNHAAQNPEHPDEKKVKLALDQTEAALHLSAHPKDNLYLIKLACLQMLNRNAEAAEMLELLVKQKPENKNYWQQLSALYLNQNKDIRAILTIERAQAHGLMNSPKDNFNLIGIYFNVGQYEKAAELLAAGLHDGKIENTQQNWELLAYSYQQLRREFKAIDVLVEAAKRFPKSGQLEYQIAQIYYSLDKPLDAIAHLQACIAKGGSAKPHQAYLFLAYLSYEQKNFTVALDAAKRAMETPEGSKEAQKMKSAIEDAIKEREAKLGKS